MPALQLLDQDGELSFRFERQADPVDPGEDPYRTRCPGPSHADAGGDVLARGSMPIARLADERFGVRVTPPAADPGGGFAVVHRGELVLDLARTRARLRVGR